MKQMICCFLSVVMLFGLVSIPAYAANVPEDSMQAVGGQDQVSPNAGAITRFSKYSPFTKNSAGTDIMTPSGFTRGTTQTGTYIATEVAIGKMTATAIRNIIKQRYLKAFISIIGSASEATMSALVEEGFTNSEINEFKKNNPDSTQINFKITTYNKSGNNSLYSEHLYSIRLYGNSSCTGIPAISVVKKVTEAT